MGELFNLIFDYNDSSMHMVCVLPLRISSVSRIGPHNEDILSLIIGSILGEGDLERHGRGSRLCIQLEQSNKSYITW